MATTHSMRAPVQCDTGRTINNESQLSVAVVRGRRTLIDCPDWCIVDHAAQSVSFIEDVHHASKSVSVTAPVGVVGTAQVQEAWITSYPYLERVEDRQPVIAFDASGEGETAELGSAALTSYADQLTAHAEALRGLARTIGGAR